MPNIGRLRLERSTAEWVALLRECSSLLEARHLHASVAGSRAMAGKDRLYISNTIIDMYGRCGGVAEAAAAFQEAGTKNSYTFNMMLRALLRNRCFADAKLFFETSMVPLHADVVSCTSMVAVYGSLQMVGEAEAAFAMIPVPDVQAWTAMISCYAQNGRLLEAEQCFSRVTRRDVVCWSALVASYGQCSQVDGACRAFRSMPQWNTIACNAMISAYAQSGHMQEARKLFDANIPGRSVVSWTALLQGYADFGCVDEAGLVLELMPGFDAFSLNAVVATHAQCGRVDDARTVFRAMCEFKVANVVSANALLKALASSGVEQVKVGFDRMHQRDAVSWTTFMTAMAAAGDVDEATLLFQLMPGRSLVAWNAIMACYAQNGYLLQSQCIFDQMPERDPISWNVLIVVYAQHKQLVRALQLFEKLPQRTVVSCNVLVSAYAQNGDLAKAVRLFRETPSKDRVSTNSMLAAYAHHGRLAEAMAVFESMEQRNVVSWNAMLAGHARNGKSSDAIYLFHCMNNEGVSPNSISFVCLLVSYGQVGLTREGREAFIGMVSDHGVEADGVHYCCMVDVLGRGGRLDDAEELIHSMPFEAGRVPWTSLLGACRMHKDVYRAEGAAKNACTLAPGDSSSYVLLANLQL